MKRLFAGVVVLLLGGCGVSATGPIPYGEPPHAAPNGLAVYFVYQGKLFPTVRSRPIAASAADAASAAPNPLDLLTAGPLEADTAAGVTTGLPAGLHLVSRRAGDDGPILFVSSESGAVDPNQLSELATAQIVCTALASTVFGTPVPHSIILQGKLASRGPLTCPLNHRNPAG